MAQIRGGRHKQLLDNLKEKRGYWSLKEAALDRTLWSTRFRKTGYRMMYTCKGVCVRIYVCMYVCMYVCTCVRTPWSSISPMTPASSNTGGQYQMMQIQSSAPDDGRRHRPKHAELIRNK
jgi:hypothetical protein